MIGENIICLINNLSVQIYLYEYILLKKLILMEISEMKVCECYEVDI